MVFILPTFCIGQREANTWCFGSYAGIHFNTPDGKPVSFTGSKMRTTEGCASISDPKTGQLLFYTDGNKVWDRAHNLMPNGTGLLGHISSTHSSIIVPLPQSKTKYLIFAVPATPSVGATYSEVDMSLNGGLGDVIPGRKNLPLRRGVNNQTKFAVADKCAAVKHKNRLDYWVVIQHNDTWDFYAYLVTANGVAHTPVISTVNAFIPASIPDYGAIKFSPNGKKLAASYQKMFAVWDFNDLTGSITNQILVNTSGWHYGLEFSSNSRWLYLNNRGIEQYDPYELTGFRMFSSRIRVTPNHMTAPGQLQLGPDERIYWSQLIGSGGGGRVLSKIDSPNVRGLNCNFVDTGLVLNWGSGMMLGLPTFVQSWFVPTDLLVNKGCAGEPTVVTLKDTSLLDSIKIDFGDEPGLNKISKHKLDSHIYSKAGTYSISALVYYWSKRHKKTLIDTLYDTIEVEGPPEVNLPDTTISFCKGDSIQLTVKDTLASIVWSDGSANRFLWLKNTGTYSVKLSAICGSAIDSVNVVTDDSVKVNLPNDTLMCNKIPVRIEAKVLNERSFRWYNGDTSRLKILTKSGVYKVFGSNICGTDSAKIEITENYSPNVYLPQDTSFCMGEEIELSYVIPFDTNNNTYQVLWNTGSSAKSILVNKTGKYSVNISNQCGTSMAETNVAVQPPPELFGIVDTQVCLKGLVYNFSTYNYSITWEDGSTNSIKSISEPGLYGFSISDEINCTNSYQFEVSECPGKIYVPNSFSPNYDGLNEEFKAYKDGVFYFSLKILDRWNNVVFESNDVSVGWNGTKNNNNGEDCPSGVYLYKIEYKDYPNSYQHSLTGTVNLIR